MSMRKTNLIVEFWLVLLVSLMLLSASYTSVASPDEMDADSITNAQQLLHRLKRTYSEIEDFVAAVHTEATSPQVGLRIKAISGPPQILKVKYLAPNTLEGQFFLLKKETLYQYLPGRNVVIEQNLSERNLPLPVTNLTPGSLLELLQSDQLILNLISSPQTINVERDRTPLQLDLSISRISRDTINHVGLSLSQFNYTYFSVPLLTKVREEYILEIIARTDKFGFDRQLIWFDKNTLLPQRLITYPLGETSKVITVVDEVKINQGLNSKELTRLPSDAEIIAG